MADKIVELIRRFTPMSSRSAEWDFLMPGSGKPQRWHEIEDAYRVLVIADPGAGKTFEAQTTRDNAQDARSTLFNMLTEVPGPDAYAAMKALKQDHPEPEYRSWMAVRARQRATQDADEPLWSVERVRDFAKISSADTAAS